MCGIFCNFTKVCTDTDKDECTLLKILQNCENNLKHRGPDAYQVKYVVHGNFKFIFSAAILWLQGNELVEQPIENDQSVFVYNGDVFESTRISEEERFMKGDTILFLQALENADNIPSVLIDIKGPYAFIYLDKVSSKLYFGRDIYGRRSLLIGVSCDQIFITSVANRSLKCATMELPAIGIFCYDLQHNTFEVYPWQHKNDNFNLKVNEMKLFLKHDIFVNQKLDVLSKKQFISPKQEYVQWIQSIQNLDFHNALNELLKIIPWECNVIKLNELLENAIKKRIINHPKFCNNCISSRQKCLHASLGILFSGGLDCAILSLIADKFYDPDRPIDLINVAFDKVEDYNTPDRLTGILTLEELKTLCPHRKWNFVEVNVTESELNEQRKRQIADLIYPLNSILDDSLGCALWFAGRGENVFYKTPCRILLVGMGADELFGGYTKHRAAMQQNSWVGLYTSLENDWDNLPYRNLARDDRVISDHGRQLRTPYLDENVVNFVRSLNPWERTCPTKELRQGLGEKILLRCLAFYLGFKETAFLRKRALQFGSKIANRKENASDVSARLL